MKRDGQVNNTLLILKGSLLAVIITLLCFIVFAIIMKFANLGEDVIGPVNQVIRVISIAIGSALPAKVSKNKGWIKGAITGGLYIVWAFVISILFSNHVSFDSILLSDVLLGLIVGAIGGIIGVNI
jgi:putative membrane protein (TIGR04086 family)